MAFRLPADTHNLTVRASIELATTQREFANLLGVSYRTAQRMLTGRSHPTDAHLQALATLVYPRDRSLAAELAAACGASLVALGIEAPPPPPPPVVVVQPAPPPPPRPRPSPRALIDSVVCAAAEAQEVMPDAIRAALLAAFERGEELALTMEEAASALRSVLRPEAVNAPPVEAESASVPASPASAGERADKGAPKKKR